MESITNFNEIYRLASIAMQESSAMKSIRELSELSRLTTVAFQESAAMKVIREINESSRLASIAFQESDAMKAIREINESSKLASIAFQESDAMKAIREINESTRLVSIAFHESDAMKAIREINESSRLASIAFQDSPAMQAMKQFSELSSIKAFSTLINSPFNELATNFKFDEQSFPASPIDFDEYLYKLDREIEEELSLSNDFLALSEKSQKILLYIYHFYFLPLLLSCFATLIMTNASETQKQLQSASSVAQVKSIARQSLDHSLLKGYRVTITNNLNLRERPNIKSNSIATLPLGTLVEVIDKSNKAWLLVAVEIDGELEQGWVSRRYTTYFK